MHFQLFSDIWCSIPGKMHNITAHNWMEIKYDIASAPMPQFSSPQRNLKIGGRMRKFRCLGGGKREEKLRQKLNKIGKLYKLGWKTFQFIFKQVKEGKMCGCEIDSGGVRRHAGEKVTLTNSYFYSALTRDFACKIKLQTNLQEV